MSESESQPGPAQAPVETTFPLYPRQAVNPVAMGEGHRRVRIAANRTPVYALLVSVLLGGLAIGAGVAVPFLGLAIASPIPFVLAAAVVDYVRTEIPKPLHVFPEGFTVGRDRIHWVAVTRFEAVQIDITGLGGTVIAVAAGVVAHFDGAPSACFPAMTSVENAEALVQRLETLRRKESGPIPDEAHSVGRLGRAGVEETRRFE